MNMNEQLLLVKLSC